MAVYFAIFQILPTFVHELFETMQSSVTRSRTSITKSLPASFKLSIFTLSSESYIKIHCFIFKNLLIIITFIGFCCYGNCMNRNLEDHADFQDGCNLYFLVNYIFRKVCQCCIVLMKYWYICCV